MHRTFLTIVFLGVWAAGSSANAQVNFSGYLKNYSVIQDSIDNDLFQFDRSYKMQNSARLMLDIFNDNQVWQLHYEAGIESNSRLLAGSDAFLAPAREGYRLSDIRSTIGPDDKKTTAPQNLDRMNVQFQLDSGDLTIGRQAITFGTARVINPTDVFLPFDVRTLNTEYRTGIDAVRFQKPIGQLGELDIGVVLGPDGKAENSSAFVQLLTNASGNDYQFTAMRFAEQNLLGVGMLSALGSLGFWLEAAQVSGDDNYTRASIGVDYAFNEDVFAMVEYHYNGAGSDDSNKYLDQLNDVAYNAGGVFLLGQNYLIPVISWQVSTLLSLSLQTLANLDDGSLFVSANADYSLSDNLYLGLGYHHFSGDDFNVSNQTQTQTNVQLGSEYGSNPDSIYASLRYYF
jgi:opacity protein-like surface antigen